MIEPTDEMVAALRAALDEPFAGDRAATAAVLAIVARDRCMEARGHADPPLADPPLAAPVRRCRKCASPLRDCVEVGCADAAQCGEVWCVEHMPDGEP